MVVMTYVLKPNAIPREIEFVNVIMIIVMNTDERIEMLSQSMSFISENIIIPTMTNAAAVTDEVNNDNTVGDIKTEKINRIPVTIAVMPVLPPSSIPVAFST